MVTLLIGKPNSRHIIWISHAPESRASERDVMMRLRSGRAKRSLKSTVLLGSVAIACIVGLFAAGVYGHGLWRRILGVIFGYALVVCLVLIAGTFLWKSGPYDANKK